MPVAESAPWAGSRNRPWHARLRAVMATRCRARCPRSMRERLRESAAQRNDGSRLHRAVTWWSTNWMEAVTVGGADRRGAIWILDRLGFVSQG